VYYVHLINVVILVYHQMMACEQDAEDEALANVPEDFLDPIMGELMRDPVVLPSSGKIVDRATIARHILRCVCFVVDSFSLSYLLFDILSSRSLSLFGCLLNKKAARVEVNISLAFLYWVGIALHLSFLI